MKKENQHICIAELGSSMEAHILRSLLEYVNSNSCAI